MSKKLCICKPVFAMYNDFGLTKCQYCTGLIQDIDRVRKYIDGNTSVNEKNREQVIEKELQKQKIMLTEYYAKGIS